MKSALECINVQDLSKHIRIVSSDEFEGRGLASRGEEKTIRYIRGEFERLGLAPGNGDSYFQEVPLVSIKTDPETELAVRGNGGTGAFAYGKDCMVATRRESETVSLEDSEMVFVGYGIVAPEYSWNDYEGLDVRGKTVVMLVNDPGFATRDPALFKGKAMTYYGRWTYKYEEAARQGAEAAFIIHETGPAGYPWEVVRNSWSGRQFGLRTEDGNRTRCAVEGWLTLESARAVFSQGGLDLERLKADSAKRGFAAVPMRLRASVSLRNEIGQAVSNNVIAVLPGRSRANEFVFYMAHWDHLGMDPSLEGDQIYNGALDNATGIAGLIQLAEAFTRLPSRPARSIAFLAVTGEEQGVLGSDFYGEHPIFPREKTVAAINMDTLNIYGKMKDVTLIGYGNSELDDYVHAAASGQGRTVRPDPEPEKGYFYRADHFSFARQGIPALYVTTGLDHVEHGEKWTLEKKAEYTENHYHKPSDEYDPGWDLTGMVEDLEMLFQIGCRLGNEDSFPNWKEGTEFRAKRDADMKAAGLK
ncbi:MAG: M28 family peptidase [Acidobacteria bacterium]|nr:M28 family peptidase [Acidobacteriota bacterium]